ncbi:MAG: dephospho-CoA kinase [Eubacteriales bacterium]|nr:dephospho-CoA kinase [Eubacteriales bacterium]
MKIIGITGGIGTGKSTILNILKEKHHAYIIETDKLAHHLMLPGEAAYTEIVKCFGEDILTDDKCINRTKLGAIVFQNQEKLAQLNAIVHPAVKQYILQDIEKQKNSHTVSYYIIEAALLIEDGYHQICDEIWCVHVEKEERIKRLMSGRGGTRQKWESIIASQSSDTYYRENSNCIIENMGDIKNIESQIEQLLYKNT